MVTALADLREARRALGALATGFDAEALVASEAYAALEELSRMEKMTVALRTLVTARLAQLGASGRQGSRSLAHEVARFAGTSVARAGEAIETGTRLASLPATEEAARRGELSFEQAALVAKGASADRAAEHQLLSVAKVHSLAELKDAVGTVVATAVDPESRRSAIHASRSLRSYGRARGKGHNGGEPRGETPGPGGTRRGGEKRAERGGGPAANPRPRGGGRQGAVPCRSPVTRPSLGGEVSKSRPRRCLFLLLDGNADRVQPRHHRWKRPRVALRVHEPSQARSTLQSRV